MSTGKLNGEIGVGGLAGVTGEESPGVPGIEESADRSLATSLLGGVRDGVESEGVASESCRARGPFVVVSIVMLLSKTSSSFSAQALLSLDAVA